MSDEADDRIISRKELARQMRRQAYQRAKEQRAKDPRHLAMKEELKKRRREQYQQLKEKRKAETAKKKTQAKVARRREQSEAREANDRELMELVVIRPNAKGSDELN